MPYAVRTYRSTCTRPPRRWGPVVGVRSGIRIRHSQSKRLSIDDARPLAGIDPSNTAARCSGMSTRGIVRYSTYWRGIRLG